MKGGGGGGGVSSSYSFPAKRRWKSLVMAVLGLVFLSMLVPLVFLLGLHSGFHSTMGNPLFSLPAPYLFRLDLAHCTLNSSAFQSGYGTEPRNSGSNDLRVFDQHNPTDISNQSKVRQSTHTDDLIRRLVPTLPQDSKPPIVKGRTSNNMIVVDESEMICQLKFGSYCLWRREQKTKMDDSMVKRMKNLLFVARAYYPSIAKLTSQENLSHEMKQNIQDFERVLSETTTDKDLPRHYEHQMTVMEASIAKAKSCHVDCNNVDKKFRQLVDLTEDEANFHMKQSAFLYKLAVKTMPKSLHCLSMRLTVEYFRSSVDIEETLVKKFVNPDFFHYIIFSRNILSSSVVINSTVLHAKETDKQVFHLLTDEENYFAMKLWFSMNKYGNAAVQVLNIKDLELHSHHKRDLSSLWNLDMGGKVNGVVQSCAVKLFHLKKYLPVSSSFDENSCSWTSGISVIDISRWRIYNLTRTYQQLVHEMSREDGLFETSTLSAGLLTFQGLVYGLEDSWMLSGLGYNYEHKLQKVGSAGVLHFDGSMKPWLELGIPKYKRFWRKYLNTQNHFLSECNVNP
ncbi:galacturonosyltransferase 7 [Striga asiatica]|uniref:Hexosyltransferase n=1 Tax=Striga asiatica TaxID=4170 RepID=A0A5A7QK76_STRAF|nr:galacturonosyltransferase 7 [Striga asiatica]